MKNKSYILVAGAVLILGWYAGTAHATGQLSEGMQEDAMAQDTMQSGQPGDTQATEEVFGLQLMTEKEVTDHKTKLASFKNVKEREQYLLQHRQIMLKRAEQAGINLSAQPAAGGMGQSLPDDAKVEK